MLNFDYKKFLADATSQPGVYQMQNASGKVIYVGKAKNLKKRLSSYFRSNIKSFDAKKRALVREIAKIELIITSTENEALLLENNLIKRFQPKFNVYFRDDKSYPYILISRHQDFPRIDFYRGPRKENADFFGPYISSHQVREIIRILQKTFRIRQCTDIFFQNRTRPCMQYQIKRCTAPCVNYIDVATYQENVHYAKMVLQGKSQKLIEILIEKMQAASARQEYEMAGVLRDQISMLRSLLSEQVAIGKNISLDLFALQELQQHYCLQVLSVRNGYLIGSQSFFPNVPPDSTAAEIVASFLEQFYLTAKRDIPANICVESAIENKKILEDIFQQKSGHRVHIKKITTKQEKNLLKLAKQNAINRLQTKLELDEHYAERVKLLSEVLQLPYLPTRIECFDVSHSAGEAAIASCVVFDERGKRKDLYRRYAIKEITPGDDYAALKQAFVRRFKHLREQNLKLPDILIIDGGKGQLKQAIEVLQALTIDNVLLLAIAKGAARKPGLEKIYLQHQEEPIALASDSPALHLLQQIRDEAHRFAITSHRHKRALTRKSSYLEIIPGIGKKRSKILLDYFGGLAGLKQASSEQISKVPGIGSSLAKQIYVTLHQT